MHSDTRSTIEDGSTPDPAGPSTKSVGGMPGDVAFHKMIVDDISDGIYYVDRARVITYWNHGAERLTGYDAHHVVGRACFADLLAHVNASGRPLCRQGCPLTATMADGSPHEADVWLRHRDGHRGPVHVRTAAVRDADGSIIGAVEIFDDATRLVEARNDVESARLDAMTDPLTGLANRRRFDQELAGRLEHLRRYERTFGLLIADIDHFKAVNDTRGHAAGDQALSTVAATLAGAARAGDLVARWGGEEFAVLVTCTSILEASSVAERLRALTARSRIRHDGRSFGVRISVGGAMARNGDTEATLLARADAALYAAKSTGRDRVVMDDALESPTDGDSVAKRAS